MEELLKKVSLKKANEKTKDGLLMLLNDIAASALQFPALNSSLANIFVAFQLVSVSITPIFQPLYGPTVAFSQVKGPRGFFNPLLQD
jgi:hypothetical protein